MDSELLALQWMEHSRIFSQAIGGLRGKAAYTDATLACEGRFFPVHKFVLSTCSEYFNAIFEWTPCVNPVVVLNNISCKELEALLDFMYIGEVNVRETQIPGVMHAAECLRIRGLTMVDDEGFKTQLSARAPSDDGPAKKKRRQDVRKSVATTSKIHLPPPMNPPPHSTSHVQRPQPPASAPQLSTEPNLPPITESREHVSLTQHKPQLQQIQLQQHTSPIQNSTLPQPPHTPQHGHMSVTQNHQDQTSPTQLLHPPHPTSPTDLSTHGQAQEVTLSQSLTPIEKVIQAVKLEHALESQAGDGAVGIPELLDSFVDIRPLYDAKAAQGEEIATFHSAEANDNLYDFTEEFPETSASSHSEVQFQRGQANTSSLVKIERASTGDEGPYKCHYCSKVCQKKENLNRHMRTHTKEPYVCSECDFTSNSYKSFLDHKKVEHTKIHKCSFCTFTSQRHDNVKRHMLGHTGEKPHKCPHCDFRAKRHQYLHKHIKNIHKKK
ncbi:transcription factor GAGA-like isoform X2 [Homarus americanus]|nr:transcription factor GAGA-like isoform X2 [Homarus americanus]